jgi:hypothetical protein
MSRKEIVTNSMVEGHIDKSTVMQLVKEFSALWDPKVKHLSIEAHVYSLYYLCT